MPQEQSRAISLLFPADLARNQLNHEWFETFAQLLAEIPHSQATLGKVTLQAGWPEGALPVLEVVEAPVAYPQLAFNLDQPLDLALGEFRITSRPVFAEAAEVAGTFDSFERVEDANGFYLRLTHSEADFKDLLTLEQFYDRVRGHLARVDHFGVNLPRSAVSQEQWEDFKAKISAQTNLYRYPEEFEWPFILPATRAEFESDITEFGSGREPRFELVYDEEARYPLFQFALETRLTQAELEERFPPPYGYAIPGLDHFFRSVFIFHHWPGLGVRFDLYYRNDNPTPDDWETGEWLVKEGGRIVER